MASSSSASYLHITHFKKPSSSSSSLPQQFNSIRFPTPLQYLHKHHHVSCIPLKPASSSTSSIHSSLSSSSSTNPPITKDDAILQAKKSLSTTLEKPLNNPKLIGKIKKLKQPKFRVEIPVIDDSPDSLSQLALEIFGDMPIKRKGFQIKTLILWPDPKLKEAANSAFRSLSADKVENFDIPSVQNSEPRILNSADVVVFMAPESSQLELMKEVSDALYPKPVVLFNPKWAFEEESDFGDIGGFVSSFEVVYCFMGLEVKGLLSKRKGVVFRCVRDGVVSGERWSVFVEEGEALKVVSAFKARPTIGEVENVLYNLMAINSPITKSAKFIRGLVSNVTGRK